MGVNEVRSLFLLSYRLVTGAWHPIVEHAGAVAVGREDQAVENIGLKVLTSRGDLIRF